MIAKKKPKTIPTWRDVKIRLAEFDRTGLLALVQDLYALNVTNQSFLHARFFPWDGFTGRLQETYPRRTVSRMEQTGASGGSDEGASGIPQGH